jgi:hypothetical protein
VASRREIGLLDLALARAAPPGRPRDAWNLRNFPAELFDLLGRGRACGDRLNTVRNANKSVQDVLGAERSLPGEALHKLLKAGIESCRGLQ